MLNLFETYCDIPQGISSEVLPSHCRMRHPSTKVLPTPLNKYLHHRTFCLVIPIPKSKAHKTTLIYPKKMRPNICLFQITLCFLFIYLFLAHVQIQITFVKCIVGMTFLNSLTFHVCHQIMHINQSIL